MNADGSGQTRLTNDPAVDSEPDWSPNGQKIAFVASRAGSPEIYVMNPDGSGQTRLGERPHRRVHSLLGRRTGRSSPSPRQRDGNPEIYTMNADGSGATRLTKNPAFDTSPDWQPAAAPPANSCGNIQGNGILRENTKAKFQFNVRHRQHSDFPTGTVHLDDTAAHVEFDSTQISSFTIAGDDATATGSGSGQRPPGHVHAQGPRSPRHVLARAVQQLRDQRTAQVRQDRNPPLLARECPQRDSNPCSHLERVVT